MRPLALALHVSVASLLVAGSASAQTILSARGGATIATLEGDGIVDPEWHTGFTFGAALTFPLSSAVGLQVGASYVRKGASFTTEDMEGAIALDYFEIPLLLVVGLPTDGSVSPHVSVGPAVAFETGCSIEASSMGVTASVDCGAGEIATKSTDFGLMGGVGVDIAASRSMAVTFDVAYTLGLTGLDDSAEPSDLKNRAWSIMAGVAFPLGG